VEETVAASVFATVAETTPETISNRCGVTTTRGRDDGVVVVPYATLLHRCYIILTTINASYSPNTPTTRHHLVDVDADDDDTLLVAVVAVTEADDTSAAVADDHASKQSTPVTTRPTPQLLLAITA
jgi:hypothetical protein